VKEFLFTAIPKSQTLEQTEYGAVTQEQNSWTFIRLMI